AFGGPPVPAITAGCVLLCAISWVLLVALPPAAWSRILGRCLGAVVAMGAGTAIVKYLAGGLPFGGGPGGRMAPNTAVAMVALAVGLAMTGGKARPLVPVSQVCGLIAV